MDPVLKFEVFTGSWDGARKVVWGLLKLQKCVLQIEIHGYLGPTSVFFPPVSVTRMPTLTGLHPQDATLTTVGGGMFVPLDGHSLKGC